MRLGLRSHFYPHLLFLGLLLLVAAIGILRVHHHGELLTRQRQQLTPLLADQQRLRDLNQAIANAHYQWTQHQDAPSAPDFRRALLDLRYQANARLADASMLAAETRYHQLQLTVATLNTQLTGGDAATAAPAPRFAHLQLLWSRLHGRVSTALEQQSRDHLAQRQRLLLEASLTFALLVVAAVLYLFSVNRYLAGPIDAVADAARRVTRGDLDARAELPPGGVVASLAIDLNRMIDILVDSLQEEERVVRELQHKTRQLEEANRHKSHFLANISHELKTPLNAIIGFADILASGHHGDLAERQKEYLHRIHHAGEHLLTMISDLIDIAKIDVGAISLAPAPVDIGTIIHEVADLLAPQLDAKGHQLRRDLPSALPTLATDPHRLRQILINLLSNAIKFTADGGEILIAAQASAEAIALAVTDTGIGIPPEHHESIFEDFVQLDSSLQKQHQGTGIGLALSRRLAGLLGGTLTVESSPGHGSTFLLTLPRSSPD